MEDCDIVGEALVFRPASVQMSRLTADLLRGSA